MKLSEQNSRQSNLKVNQGNNCGLRLVYMATTDQATLLVGTWLSEKQELIS